MAGADIVYYEHASKKLVDSFSVGNAKPTEDPCQDWTLVKAEQIGGKLTVHVSRKLVSSDTMDRNFTDDSAYPLQLTPVIAAWGDSAGIQYHTTSGRAAAGVRFFGTSEAEAIEKLKADGSLLTKDVLAENFAVPTTETTYHEFCYDVQTLFGLPDASTAYHIVGFEAIIKEDTRKYLHHYTIYGNNEVCPDAPENPMAGYEKGPLIWPWAPGVQDSVLPDTAGIRVLGEGGFKALVLQIHYDNVDGDEGKVDTSGFRMYYTQTLRQHDAGVLQIGDPGIRLSRSPTIQGGHSYLALKVGAEQCTDLFTANEVTVFTRFLHMHQAGVRMQTTQYRDGKTLREDAVDFYDFKQSGAFEPRSTGTGFTIKRGDSFLVECWYTVAEGSEKRFGLGSADEMCIDFLYYYPLQTSHDNECHFDVEEGEPKAELMTGINRVFSSQSAVCPDGTALSPPPGPHTKVDTDTSLDEGSAARIGGRSSWNLHLVSSIAFAVGVYVASM
eukprot:Tamp_10295.p1 GENE.Tamp_10295~~Tamp_10295.p1  ORF type:complete len:498 (+),score=84.99 Tamp_10295:504-1997(+)